MNEQNWRIEVVLEMIVYICLEPVDGNARRHPTRSLDSTRELRDWVYSRPTE